MADPRPKHYTMGPSLMNQPLYNGAANAMYGPRGPARASPDYGDRRPGEPPTSLADHIEDALKKVKGLSAQQRNAVRAAMTVMLRDIGFNKLMAEQTRAHAMDEGRPL
jgi:hypothetical protein